MSYLLIAAAAWLGVGALFALYAYLGLKRHGRPPDWHAFETVVLLTALTVAWPLMFCPENGINRMKGRGR